MFTVRAASLATAALFFSAAMLFGATTTATASPNDDKLLALLSGGYTAADCKPSKLYPEDPFLARLGCDQNSEPGGPLIAIYSLYGNGADLAETFGHYANAGSPLACPGSIDPAPIAWEGGMVVCTLGTVGSSYGLPTLSWTNAANLLTVSALGDDLASVYAWWLTAR